MILKLSSSFNLGSGSTWPGHIALIINRKFIKEIINKNQHLKIVLIAGTNGKTTTSKLSKFILEKNSKKVFLNETGANLLNGVASSLIKNSNLSERLNYDVAIFEIDENTLQLILKEVKPDAVVILNLFRDQLDRYGEVNTIAKKWIESLSKLGTETKLILNGDDPLVSYLGYKRKLNTFYFGISDSLLSKKEIPHDVDSIYCPNCSSKLVFKTIAYSHLGDFECRTCGFKREKIHDFSDIKITYPLVGKYNIYNTNAVILFLNKVFDISPVNINKFLVGFKPAFGRQEVVRYKGKNVIILLSKNPTGFNQSIEAFKDYNFPIKNVLIVLNDRVPDGKDVSWIWDVDFEDIVSCASKIFISGDRTYDMGIRFMYTQKNFQFPISNFQIEGNLKIAVDKAVDATKKDQTLFILPTYSAMLEIRKILTGKKCQELILNFKL